MNDPDKRMEGRTYSVSIGNEKITFRPETKLAIDLELILWHIPLYLLIAAFSLDYIGWPLFLLLFYMVAMRIFIGNHDRYHADHRVRLPRFLEAFSEGLAVVVTPWDEPYDSIRPKHLRHHTTHGPGKEPVLDTRQDPHGVFELGGLLRVFLSCLFYEEVQLLIDIRNRNLTLGRLYRFLIYVPLQVAYILYFGWWKFLVIFLGMRITGFAAWFVFSWGIHQSFVYRFGFSRQVPRWFKWGFALLHGRRVTEGCIHHATHHAWPAIPYNQLHRFDRVARQQQEAAPVMIPSGA